jgi:WD domain, G-beta repeat
MTSCTSRLLRRSPAIFMVLTFALFLLVPASRSVQPDKDKLAEPDAAALAKAQKTLNKMFKDDLAKAKTEPAAARELADVLLREARQTSEDPPLRFAALVLARDLAAQAGDTTLALAAIDELSKHYVFEALVMKAKMLILAADKVASKEDHHGITETALGFLEEALANDNYKIAEELVKAAEDSASKSKNLQLVARVEKRVQEVDQAKKEFGRMQKFVDILAKTPDDPAANAEMGKYFCLVKGNWERGLPMLVKGGEKGYLDLAKRDLASPRETRAQLDLGDEYDSLADEQKGLAQKMLLKRALYWYARCLPNLDRGLNKIRIEKRVEEIAKLFPATTVTVAATNAPITGLIRIFDKAHINGIQVLAISPDGKRALSGGIQEGTVRLWDVGDGKQTRAMPGHKDEIWGVAFSPDGNLCASASTDKTMRVWETSTGNPVRVFSGHTDWVRGVYFFPDKARILTASDDKTLRIWDLKDGNTLKQMFGHNNFINSLSVSRDGKRAVTGSVDMTVRVWDLDKAQEIAKFTLPQEVWAVAISPDGRTVASATVLANNCKLWNVESKAEIRALPLPARAWSIAFAPSGKTLAIGTGGLVNNVPQGNIEGGWPQQGGFDDSIYFFEADSGKAIRRLTGHTANVRALAFSNDGRLLISGGDDNAIRLWGEAKK